LFKVKGKTAAPEGGVKILLDILVKLAAGCRVIVTVREGGVDTTPAS